MCENEKLFRIRVQALYRLIHGTLLFKLHTLLVSTCYVETPPVSCFFDINCIHIYPMTVLKFLVLLHFSAQIENVYFIMTYIYIYIMQVDTHLL